MMLEKEESVPLQDPLMEGEKPRSKKKYFIFLGFIILIIVAIVLIVVLTKDDKDKKDDDDDNYGRDDAFVIPDQNWTKSYERANEFISKLSRTEKVNILFGTENMRFLDSSKTKEEEYKKLCVGQIDAFKNKKVKFPGMCLQDGPAGIRFVKGKGISWQSNLNLASTFNKTLMYEVGKAQGEENREKGISTFLSPCVNIMRTPQAGRVWEAFGEDPYYSGVCASQLIKGIQYNGVMATIKHFVGNDQETYRHASSSNIDMRALMDIYVEPFYRAIHDAKVVSIMSGYNAVNNTYCSENKFLLTDILRGILDFQGFVMSDWWAIYTDHPDNFNSGLDMNMPGGKGYGDFYGRENSYWSNLEKYVDEGKIPEERITESATRIIASMYQMEQLDHFPKTDIYKETKTKERIKLQRTAATESQILLKNEDNILPLKNIKSIAVIGNDAEKRDCQNDDDMACKNDTNKVQNGHIPLGYGSGTTTFGYLISPLEGIKELAGKKNIEVKSSCKLIYGDEVKESSRIHVNATEDIDGALEIVKEVDVVIIFAKADSGEEYIEVEESIGDRKDLNLWHGANKLIEEVAKINNNIIVVINAPAVVNVPWLDNVKGLIFSGFPGAESGNAIADILFGEVFPSGHLPYAWGEIDDYGAKIEHLTNYSMTENNKSYKDEYRYDGIDSAGHEDTKEGHDKEQYNYTEGLYVGQRWFNKQNKKPIFPFGYGLTYTTFNYSDLNVSMGEEGLTAEFNVTNIGEVTGSAVPMMFLTFPDNIGEYPKYIFKGFEKILLTPGETQRVSITADAHALSYFNVEKNNYVRVEEGNITVYIAENGNPDDYWLKEEIDSKF